MNDGAPPVAFDTLVLASHAMRTDDVECYLRQRGVGVSVRAHEGAVSNACVVLSAHEFQEPQLLKICASMTDCWVHLVSAGTEYSGLPNLCRHNLLTRSWKAYGRPLTEYVVSALLDVAWREGHHWQPGGRATGRAGLFGQSALVFGFGAIGRNIAATLQAMGVLVSVLHRERQPHPDDGLHHLTLAELAGEYDHFILALPGSQTTRHLVDDGVLRHLKRQGHLVNVGRGTTVDTQALCRALDEREIWATLDVTDPEPLPPDHILRRYERARISNHVAWQSGDSELCFLDDWMPLWQRLQAGTGVPREALAHHRFAKAGESTH